MSCLAGVVVIIFFVTSSQGKYEECGRVTPSEELIVGGISAKHGEIPWHAGIYSTLKTPYRQICGGSLVSRTAIISAAHCFWNEELLPASNYAVAVGKIYRPWDESHDPDVQKSNVTEIKIPNNYFGSLTHVQQDIAIVTISTPIEYNAHIRPVCVSFNLKLEEEQLKNNNYGKVAGWGLTDTGKASPVLKVAELSFVDVETCFNESPFDFKGYITGDKFCAGQRNGTAVCKGDSGGGLAFPAKDRGVRYYLRGIVSTAPTSEVLDTCNGFVYTTFTQISRHQLFITQHVKFDADIGITDVQLMVANTDNQRVSGSDSAVGSGSTASTPCLLPEYPVHGSYEVPNLSDAAPGQAYDTVVLNIKCYPGYGVDSISRISIYCYNGTWSDELPQCIRTKQFCNLPSNKTVEYSCSTLGNDTYFGSCPKYIPSGTVISRKCQQGYYYNGALRKFKCDDGKWDHKILECKRECGRLVQSANLTTGQQTEGAIERLPWYAAIYSKLETPYKQICSGTVITTNVVVSAAHCFWNGKLRSALDFAVAAGKIYRLWDDNRDEHAQKSDVTDIVISQYIYPGQATIEENDIGLVVLETKLVYNFYVSPICVHTDDDLSGTRKSGELIKFAVTAGWGLVPDDFGSQKLNVITDFPAIDSYTWIDELPTDLNKFLTSDKISAGYYYGTKALCNGNNGGGLYTTKNTDGMNRYYITGVMVTPALLKDGNGCLDTYGIYTNIYFQTRILGEINRFGDELGDNFDE